VDTTRPQGKSLRAIKEYLKRDQEKEMWTAGYKYSWRKMEAAGHDKSWLETSGLWPIRSTGSDQA